MAEFRFAKAHGPSDQLERKKGSLSLSYPTMKDEINGRRYLGKRAVIPILPLLLELPWQSRFHGVN